MTQSFNLDFDFDYLRRNGLKRPLVSFEPLKLFFRWCVAAGCAGGTAGRSPSPACASGAAVRFWGGVVRWVVGCGGGMRWNAAFLGVADT